MPDGALDTDRPLTAEFGEVFRVGDMDRRIGLSSGHLRAWGSTVAATCSSLNPDAAVVAVCGPQWRTRPDPRDGEARVPGSSAAPTTSNVRAGEVRAPAPDEEASGATDEPSRFDPPLLFDVLPDGSVAYSDSAGYSIKLVAGDGPPIGTIARPLTPKPVTTEVETTVRDSAMAEFERLYGDPANQQVPDRAPPELMAQMVARMRADIEGMQFNHEIPVVLSLRATWEGGLWVRRRREGDPWEGAVGVREGAARRIETPRLTEEEPAD